MTWILSLRAFGKLAKAMYGRYVARWTEVASLLYHPQSHQKLWMFQTAPGSDSSTAPGNSSSEPKGSS